MNLGPPNHDAVKETVSRAAEAAIVRYLEANSDARLSLGQRVYLHDTLINYIVTALYVAHLIQGQKAR
jgi:hypothetical protein